MSGWDDFTEAKVPDEAQVDLLDKLFVECFATEPGRKVLAYWKLKYLDQPVCVPGAGAEVGFHREGQNSLVREVMTRVRRGLTPKGANNAG